MPEGKLFAYNHSITLHKNLSIIIGLIKYQYYSLNFNEFLNIISEEQKSTGIKDHNGQIDNNDDVEGLDEIVENLVETQTCNK